MKNRYAVWLCVAVFFFYASLVCYRYVHLAYYDWDMAYLNQILWALSHGQFYSSLFGLNYLGGHAELIDLFFLPVFFFFQHPLTFSFIQIFFFVLSSWVLYRIALDDLGRWEALLLMFLYLIFPANFFAMCHDHNSESLAPFFILLAIFFYRKKAYVYYLVSLIFLILIKENTSLIVMMLGLWGLFARDRSRLSWGALPFFCAGIYFFVIVKWAIPYCGGFDKHMLWSRYSHLGSDSAEILANLLNIKTFSRIVFSTGNLAYLSSLFGILIIPALLSPRVLLLLAPIALYHMLSNNMAEKGIFYYYGAIMTPVIFYAVIQTLRRFIRHRRIRIICCLLFLFFSLFHLYSLRPAIVSKVGADRPRSVLRHWNLVHKIPDDAGVIATFEFLTALSLRSHLYSFHKVYDRYYQDPKFIARSDFYSTGPFHLPRGVDYALIDFNDPWLLSRQAADHDYVHEHISSFLKGWVEIDSTDSVKLYRRVNPVGKDK